MGRMRFFRAGMAAVAVAVVLAVPSADAQPAPAGPARTSVCTPSSTPGQRWVQAVYRRLLGRCAEEAAAKYGDTIVGDSAKRGAYTRAIVRSIENGYRWANHWTRTYCDRAPGPNEGRLYANKLAVTAPNDRGERWELVHNLVLDLYCTRQKFGGTKESYVRGLYRVVLGREASEADVQFWAKRSDFNSVKLAQSSEGRRVQVRRSYEAILRRPATQSDIDFWAPRLLPTRGYDKLNLDAALAASSEFVRKAAASSDPPF